MKFEIAKISLLPNVFEVSEEESLKRTAIEFREFVLECIRERLNRDEIEWSIEWKTEKAIGKAN